MKRTLFLIIGLVIGMFIACSPIPKVPPAASTTGVKGTESSSSTTIVVPRKPKTPNISIEWLSPTPADASVRDIAGKVEIKVRINTNIPIEPNQIDIYINNTLLSSKADEVSLLKRPEYSDQILTMQVPIAAGSNAVQVVVTTSAEQRFYAERVITKDAKGIKVASGALIGNTRIIWMQPDAIALRGQMFTTKNKELEIRLNITSPDVIKKENIQILFNKIYRSPSAAAELVGSGGSYNFRDVVTLNEKADINEVGIKVFTPSSNFESEKLKVNYAPVRPNVYLLSIGTRLNLKYAYKDARDFTSLYHNQGRNIYKLFNTVQVDTLIGSAAVTNEIRGMIETIKNKFRTGQVVEDDIVMLFISSHGFLDERGDFRIQGDDYSPERRNSTSVSYKNDILAQLEALPCKKIIFIDACHSGGARANAADILSAIHDIRNAPRGFAIMTSSSNDEESYEDVKWQNGAFTEAIISGLKNGKADANGNGIITLIELENYVKQEVPTMVQSVKNKLQHPRLSRNDIGDLPIFVVNK